MNYRTINGDITQCDLLAKPGSNSRPHKELIGMNVRRRSRRFQAMNGQAPNLKLQPGKTPGKRLNLYLASTHQLQFGNHALADPILKAVAVQKEQKPDNQRQHEERDRIANPLKSFGSRRSFARTPAHPAKNCKPHCRSPIPDRTTPILPGDLVSFDS